MAKAGKIHLRYWHDASRADLWALALCNNINGAICDAAHLTDKVEVATCGRCLRIKSGVRSPNGPPWTAADLRRLSLSIAGHGKIDRKLDRDMMRDAREQFRPRRSRLASTRPDGGK